mmetsp:Transcript_4825/g.15057  ORF Transcript_4825/g.15057 Transcript_4825/m.15057 type:complete len:322 (+) Transcript_4825:177-1142(+)
MATFKLGGEDVKTFNDEEFSKLRSKWGLADDFLASFDITKMAAGGGKGGQLMAFTPDKLYLVKEVNEADQATILKIAGAYVAHLLSDEGSLLARFFLHFEREGKNFIVMNNWLPPPRYDAAPPAAELGFDIHRNYNQFDLKGCADDKTLKALGRDVDPVHKRIFNVPMWFGDFFWSKQRHRYYEGKLHARETSFHVAPAAKAEIAARTKRDVAFLQEAGLMDYSLVVSYHALPLAKLDVARAVYSGTSDGGAQPYVGTNAKQVLVCYVGIIDYLQDWNWKKEVAQCIKFAECNKATVPPQAYGDRFATFVSDKFVDDCAAA